MLPLVWGDIDMGCQCHPVMTMLEKGVSVIRHDIGQCWKRVSVLYHTIKDIA